MEWTNVLIAFISSIGVVLAAWIAKQQPTIPHVERGVELIDRWDDLIEHAHDVVHSYTTTLWGFSNGKKYYDGTHAQVMNLLSSCSDDDQQQDEFMTYQNIPIRVMLRYIRNITPNKISYFDESTSRNVIAREHIQNGIQTVAIFPVYAKRRYFKWFSKERLIQVIIFKFKEKDFRFTNEQLTSIELVALNLSTIKIKE